jgi:hypothetical protein
MSACGRFRKQGGRLSRGAVRQVRLDDGPGFVTQPVEIIHGRLSTAIKTISILSARSPLNEIPRPSPTNSVSEIGA